jgi:hypothetical protein
MLIMFLRLFNIALIIIYIFCTYAQVLGTGLTSAPHEIVFSASLNHSKENARYTSAILQKHTVKFEKSKAGDQVKEVNPNYNLHNIFAFHSNLSLKKNLSRVLFECTLNKAPPVQI